MCEYCEDGKPLGASSSRFDGVEAEIEGADLVVGAWYDSGVGNVPLYIPINYCPMCGRDLRGETMTKLYISGPVTGIKDDNRLAFSWAQNRLMDAGYEPFIPHEIVEPDDTHETAMLLCVNELTERTQKRGARYPVPAFDGVALLPGWEQSEGARLEKAVAEACGIPVKTVDEWLEEAR